MLKVFKRCKKSRVAEKELLPWGTFFFSSRCKLPVARCLLFLFFFFTSFFFSINSFQVEFSQVYMQKCRLGSLEIYNLESILFTWTFFLTSTKYMVSQFPTSYKWITCIIILKWLRIRITNKINSNLIKLKKTAT